MKTINKPNINGYSKLLYGKSGEVLDEIRNEKHSNIIIDYIKDIPKMLKNLFTKGIPYASAKYVPQRIWNKSQKIRDFFLEEEAMPFYSNGTIELYDDVGEDLDKFMQDELGFTSLEPKEGES